MRTPYNILNWYWIVTAIPGEVFSTKTGTFVPVTDTTYNTWKATGGWEITVPAQTDLVTTLMSYPQSVNLNLFNIFTLQQAQSWQIQAMTSAYYAAITTQLSFTLSSGVPISLAFDDRYYSGNIYNKIYFTASAKGFNTNFVHHDHQHGLINIPFSTTDWASFNTVLTNANTNVATQQAHLTSKVNAINAATTNSAVAAITW